jgi:hypothetical protein
MQVFNSKGDHYTDIKELNRPFNETTQGTCGGAATNSRLSIDPAGGWSFTMTNGIPQRDGNGTLQGIASSVGVGNLTFPTPKALANIMVNWSATVTFGSNKPRVAEATAQKASLRTALPPAIQASPEAALSLYLHDDSTLEAAHARLAPPAQTKFSKRAGESGLELSDLVWQDIDRLIDPLPEARLFAV